MAGTALAQPPFPTINSTTPLSMDSLVALGFQYSPAFRQTALDTRLNSIGRLNAIGNFLPTIGVGMSFSQTHYRNPTFTNPDGSVSTYPITFEENYVQWDSAGLPHLATRTVTQEVPEGDSRSSSMYLSIDESLFEGGRRYFLYRVARAQEEINNLSVVDGQKSLTRRIAQQVMVVLTQEQLLVLNQRLLDQRKDALALAKARFDVGAVTELDVLQAEIKVGSAENAVTSVEQAVQGQQEVLNELLGIDIKSRFPMPAAEAITPLEFNIDSLVTSAYTNRTDLAIADLTVKRATHTINIGKADYLPSVSLGMQISRSEQSGKRENWTVTPRNENTSYALSLRWNLFNGFTREYNIATQRVARDRAMENLRQLRLSVDRAVRDAYYNLNNVFNQLQITTRNRELAERQLNLERERYRLGATSALALRDAQVVYARAETDHLQKMLEYQSSVIALELAVGRPIR